jgi:hypothetical protein
MASREKSVQDRAREADRYREAAELALEQLEWAVNYLNRIGRPALATGLDKNRKLILAGLEGSADSG